MNDIEIVAQRQRIENLFSYASNFNADPETLSHWAKYLCVLTSGYLEKAIQHYFSEFSRIKAHPCISNYVTHNLVYFINPNIEKMLNLFDSFSKDWKDKLETFVKGERKDAIDSIVANKNNIAHGRQIGLTFSRMKTYFQKAVEVVDFLKEIIKSEI